MLAAVDSIAAWLMFNYGANSCDRMYRAYVMRVLETVRGSVCSEHGPVTRFCY